MESIAYEELLRQEGRIITHVVGGSMMPLLYHRESIVIVEAVDRVPPRRGDVVLFKYGSRYILHRILQVKPGEYLIRGDNTWSLEHVPEKALLATMTGFYRHPKGRLISRDDLSYRLYCLLLPCIRTIRRAGGICKRVIRKALSRHRRTRM